MTKNEQYLNNLLTLKNRLYSDKTLDFNIWQKNMQYINYQLDQIYREAK